MSTQIGNKAEGDFAGRDIHKTTTVYAQARTPMAGLVEKFKAETTADQVLTSLIEKLEHYFSKETTTDVRGLEEKLTVAERSDLLAEAMQRKERAYKLIMRNQSSPTAQIIFAFILAEIVVSFEQAVRPLIQAKAPRTEIDKAILTEVINPAVAALEENPLQLNKLDIQGLLYFLGGNCHVRWDPC
jgi:hypothetical protein